MKKLTFNLDDSPEEIEAQTTAFYDTECPWCIEPVLTGDRIVCRDGEWGHGTCPRPFTRDQVCKKCFLIHNGDCY